jgi:hypothetical protein
MPTWTAEINSGAAFAFDKELDKQDASSGDFRGDYLAVCSRLAILPCPFVSFDPPAKSCRIANCAIDEGSWRAALIACTMTNSPANNFIVYNCTLTPRFISDLCSMLDKRFVFGAVKLDHIDWGAVDEAEINTALARIISANATVSYLSLRGNRLQDSFVTAVAPALLMNVYIRGLNLANNSISDAGVRDLLNVLRCNISVERLSLKNNAIAGRTLGGLIDLIYGSPCSAEEDASFKAVSKAAGDKNKAIKELNKKRKKAGETEIEEISIPERIVKVGKTDLVLTNKQLKTLDLSHSLHNEEDTSAFVASLAVKRQTSPDVSFSVISRVTQEEGDNYLSRPGFSLIM